MESFETFLLVIHGSHIRASAATLSNLVDRFDDQVPRAKCVQYNVSQSNECRDLESRLRPTAPLSIRLFQHASKRHRFFYAAHSMYVYPLNHINGRSLWRVPRCDNVRWGSWFFLSECSVPSDEIVCLLVRLRRAPPGLRVRCHRVGACGQPGKRERRPPDAFHLPCYGYPHRSHVQPQS